MRRPRLHDFVACALILSAGCSALRVPTALRTGQRDTPTYARTAARNNTSDILLTPPLKLLWQQDVTAGIGMGSLLYVDTTLFVGNLRGELYALNPATGKRYGWASLGGSIEGTPVIDRELAIVPLAGTRESLIAYDIVNAKPVWRAVLGDIHASPLLSLGRVFIGNVQGRFFAIDRSTGEELWHYDIPGNTALKGIRSSAASSSPHVIFGADDGAIYSLDAMSGTLRWRFECNGAVQAAPVIADSAVFAGTLKGVVHAIRLDTGRQIWSDSVGGSIYGPPLISSGHCIVGTTGGTIVALDQRNGASVWSTDVHAPVNSGLLGVRGMLYAGTLDKELLAIDPLAGNIVWKDTVSARIKTMPIAGGNRLFIATDDRLIQAYGETRK